MLYTGTILSGDVTWGFGSGSSSKEEVPMLMDLSKLKLSPNYKIPILHGHDGSRHIGYVKSLRKDGNALYGSLDLDDNIIKGEDYKDLLSILGGGSSSGKVSGNYTIAREDEIVKDGKLVGRYFVDGIKEISFVSVPQDPDSIVYPANTGAVPDGTVMMSSNLDGLKVSVDMEDQNKNIEVTADAVEKKGAEVKAKDVAPAPAPEAVVSKQEVLPSADVKKDAVTAVVSDIKDVETKDGVISVSKYELDALIASKVTALEKDKADVAERVKREADINARLEAGSKAEKELEMIKKGGHISIDTSVDADKDVFNLDDELAKAEADSTANFAREGRRGNVLMADSLMLNSSRYGNPVERNASKNTVIDVVQWGFAKDRGETTFKDSNGKEQMVDSYDNVFTPLSNRMGFSGDISSHDGGGGDRLIEDRIGQKLDDLETNSLDLNGQADFLKELMHVADTGAKK